MAFALHFQHEYSTKMLIVMRLCLPSLSSVENKHDIVTDILYFSTLDQSIILLTSCIHRKDGHDKHKRDLFGVNGMVHSRLWVDEHGHVEGQNAHQHTREDHQVSASDAQLHFVVEPNESREEEQRYSTACAEQGEDVACCLTREGNQRGGIFTAERLEHPNGSPNEARLGNEAKYSKSVVTKITKITKIIHNFNILIANIIISAPLRTLLFIYFISQLS